MLEELLSVQRSSPSADLHGQQRACLSRVPLSALARGKVGIKSTDPSQSGGAPWTGAVNHNSPSAFSVSGSSLWKSFP